MKTVLRAVGFCIQLVACVGIYLAIEILQRPINPSVIDPDRHHDLAIATLFASAAFLLAPVLLWIPREQLIDRSDWTYRGRMNVSGVQFHDLIAIVTVSLLMYAIAMVVMALA